MSVEFKDPIDLNQLELQNVQLQQLGSDPATPVEGQIWHRSDLHKALIFDNTRARRIAWEDPDYTDYIPQALYPAWKEGRLFYDSATHTLTLFNDVTNTSLQIGQETWIRVRNRSGSTIGDGKVVYISGATGQTPEIMLAQEGVQKPYEIIGVCTADIADQGFGWVTVIGTVSNIDTSTLTEGQPVYLSTTVPGGLTSTHSDYGNHTQIGFCLYQHGVNGKILVRVADHTHYALQEGNTLAKDPSGFTNPAGITVTYDSTARTITLTGDLEYLWQGERKTLTSPWTSSAHSATADQMYFLSSSDGTNFTWSTTPWEFAYVQVAYVSYGSTHKWAQREVHGAMPWTVHKELHERIGTYRQSGGNLTAGTYLLAPVTPTDAGNRPGIDATVVQDEDLASVITAFVEGGTYTQIYGNASNQPVITTGAANIVPVGGSYIQYNNAGVLTELTTGRNMNVYLIAIPTTDDAGSKTYRYLWAPGSAEYSTATAARAELPNLNLGTFSSLSPEYNICLQVTLGTSAAYGTVGKFRIESIQTVSGTRSDPVTIGGTGVSDHNLLSGLLDPGQHAIATTIGLQAALDSKVDENAPITGATKTKITYDNKGLVTAGADAAIADITGLQTALDGKQPLNSKLTGISNIASGTGLMTRTADSTFTNRWVVSGTGTSVTNGSGISGDIAVNVSYGTTSGTACQGNDSRLSDARTPTAHASTHGNGGSDAITTLGGVRVNNNIDMDGNISGHFRIRTPGDDLGIELVAYLPDTTCRVQAYKRSGADAGWKTLYVSGSEVQAYTNGTMRFRVTDGYTYNSTPFEAQQLRTYNDMWVVNAAGNAWNRWGIRANDKMNLDVGYIGASDYIYTGTYFESNNTSNSFYHRGALNVINAGANGWNRWASVGGGRVTLDSNNCSNIGTISSSLMAHANISGGGIIRVRSGWYVSWDRGFIVIAIGQGPLWSTDGHFRIDMPAVGTNITVAGGTSPTGPTRSVTNDGIALYPWESLQYVLPVGSGNTSLNANFLIVPYNNNYVPSQQNVIICTRTADVRNSLVHWTVGNIKQKEGDTINLEYSTAQQVVAKFGDTMTGNYTTTNGYLTADGFQIGNSAEYSGYVRAGGNSWNNKSGFGFLQNNTTSEAYLAARTSSYVYLQTRADDGVAGTNVRVGGGSLTISGGTQGNNLSVDGTTTTNVLSVPGATTLANAIVVGANCRLYNGYNGVDDFLNIDCPRPLIQGLVAGSSKWWLGSYGTGTSSNTIWLNVGTNDASLVINTRSSSTDLNTVECVAGRVLFPYVGWHYRPYTSDASYGAIYGTGVTPGATNYSLAIKSNGTESVINSTASTRLSCGGTKYVEANTTGIGFFGKAPVARPTGVAVTAAGIHAALVSLGLITA